MATISTQLFNRVDDRRAEQEQLLKLFWNRAELKKEFDKLRAERAELDEQMRKQEAVTLRVQQRLDQLEALLANPETSQRAMTYYQLRGIWRAAHERIAALAVDLERTCRDRELREHSAAFRSRLNDQLAERQREASRVQQVDDDLAAEVRQLREKRGRKFGVWNFFVRRRLTAEIRIKREERKIIGARLTELAAEQEALQATEPPPFVGLSIAAKRLINLRTIAHAQELCLSFAGDDLANLAREAATRDIADVRYGSRRDSRDLSHTIETARQALEADKTLLKRVQQRARYLGRVCEYRNDEDTVPMAGSLAAIDRLDAEGRKTGVAAGVNVLVDEYWEIFSVLLE